MELEEKIASGYNRLSSIAGNIAPTEISQWFREILSDQPHNKKDNKTIKSIMHQVYQGNPISNLKKEINHQGIPMGICRNPIGNS